MEDGFQKRTVLCYSNFMKYIISFSFFNIILIIIENSSIIYSVDVMLDGDKILNELKNSTISKKLKEKSKKKKKLKRLLDDEEDSNGNEEKNATIEPEIDPMVEMYERITGDEKYFDIKFKGHVLYSLDNSYCVYNKNLIYISFSTVILVFILIVSLFFLNTRKRKNLLYQVLGYTITNLINIIIRPFFIAIVSLLVNRPLLYLYRSSYMSSEYIVEESIYMVVSLIMLVFFIVIVYLMHDYINNVFCFEKFPYDCFITSEENVLMFIKVCIGFKLTYDKIMGLNGFSVINLIVGL